MKISVFAVVLATTCLAATEAQKTKDTGTPAPTPSVTMAEEQLEGVTQQQDDATPAPKKRKEATTTATASPTISYKKVKPFEEPKPSSVTEKAAIEFKPQLHVAKGCHAYPAVNEAGQISTWLEKADAKGAKCKGSKLGAQIYGRSAWFGRVWAIMYAWYFPDVTPDWEHVIVWTNNPNVTDQVILAVTTSNSTGGYTSQTPPDASMVSSTSVKVSYSDNALATTTEGGHTQDLIMWHQLSDAAQEALNNDQSFAGVQVPMNDDYFLLQLGKAWPFA
ncbi:hypothetical protein ON010_g947 [Phytophthora cinnamomi]|nr:hypothetical protein ON010_g947 [Phytophthora cinnamomi]